MINLLLSLLSASGNHFTVYHSPCFKSLLFSEYLFIWMGFRSYLDIDLQMFVLFSSCLIADLFCETSVLLRSGFSAKYRSLGISRQLI